MGSGGADLEKIGILQNHLRKMKGSEQNVLKKMGILQNLHRKMKGSEQNVLKNDEFCKIFIQK